MPRKASPRRWAHQVTCQIISAPVPTISDWSTSLTEVRRPPRDSSHCKQWVPGTSHQPLGHQAGSELTPGPCLPPHHSWQSASLTETQGPPREGTHCEQWIPVTNQTSAAGRVQALMPGPCSRIGNLIRFPDGGPKTSQRGYPLLAVDTRDQPTNTLYSIL
jgi:hypothetical protein